MSSLKPKIYFKRLLKNTAFGVLVGFISALCLAAVIDADVPPGIKEFYIFILTAVLSLIAAALTLIGVFATIESQQEIELRARRKRLEAARAFLPSALSKLCNISNHGVLYSSRFEIFRADMGMVEFRDRSLSDLDLTDEIISVFREIVELCEDDAVAQRISGLLREHQVFFARWQSEFEVSQVHVIVNSEDIRLRTVAWAYLGAIASSIFEYARGEADTISTTVSGADIASWLRNSGYVSLHEDDYSSEIGLYERTFERRFI